MLEQAIANTAPRPDLRQLIEPEADAWALEFPDLTSLDIAAKGTTGIKVCIATEDIVGPVRNGGIGTTYSFLAKVLAAEGFDVTVLYLRGDYVEIGTLDDWIKYYADHGVKFITVDDYYGAEKGRGNSDRWTGPMYNMYRHLQDNHYDIVHVSEWRGSGYLSLLAKRQGVCFEDTRFVVKCSSPWLWNRLYGSHPLKAVGDLDKIHAEQKSVELGDHIIGGSAHLLRWMASQGYRLAKGRTFVQPNIISTEVLDPIIAERANQPGDLIPAEEIVFFGRLEARKGVDLFCEAIDGLLRRGVTLPAKITFMGKAGQRLETRPEQNILEFITEATADWPTEVQILTEFQQEQALRYLLGGNRLAVMPSVIENSSLAVYEAVICGIPFIASNSGGTPELVQPEYHEDVLCDAHPYSLALKLERALAQGGRVARPTFDNRRNSAVWMEYHRNMAAWQGTIPAAPKLASEDLPEIAVVIPHRDQIAELKITLKALESCGYPKLKVIVADDGSHQTETLIELDLIKRKLAKRDWIYLETPGIELSLAANAAVARSTAPFLYFTRPGNALLPGALERLVTVAEARNLGTVTGFAREYIGRALPASAQEGVALHMPILGNPAYTMLSNGDWHWDMLVRRSAFEAIGGFTGDFRQFNDEKELCHALEMNGYPGETVPEPLYWMKAPDPQLILDQRYNRRASEIRALRPSLRYGPLFYRNLILFAFGAWQRLSAQEEQLTALRRDRDRQLEHKAARVAERDTFRARLQEVERRSSRAEKELPRVEARCEKLTLNLQSTADKLKARNAEIEQMRQKLRSMQAKPVAAGPAAAEADAAEGLEVMAAGSAISEVETLREKLRERNLELTAVREKLAAERGKAPSEGRALRVDGAAAAGGDAVAAAGDADLRAKLKARNAEVEAQRDKLKARNAEIEALREKLRLLREAQAGAGRTAKTKPATEAKTGDGTA